MTDYFTELGLPHSAWLEPDDIKACHRRRISDAHPDKPGGDTLKAALLNEARRVLESPPGRLRHLVSLRAPDFTPETKAAPDWELFSKTGESVREATLLADQLARATSPIVRAGLLARSKHCQQLLAASNSRLDELARSLELRTRALQLDSFDAAAAWSLAEEWTFLDRLTDSLHLATTALRTA